MVSNQINSLQILQALQISKVPTINVYPADQISKTWQERVQKSLSLMATLSLIVRDCPLVLNIFIIYKDTFVIYRWSTKAL